MRIDNVIVWREGAFQQGAVSMADGLFCEDSDGESLDAEGLFVLPGLIDVHVHGYGGGDFSAGEAGALDTMARGLVREGVTAFCAATMSLEPEALERACRAAAGFAGGGASLLGINLEGPFLSPARAGAHERRHLRGPEAALFERLQRAADGDIRLMTVAPELPGAEWLVAHAASRGVTVSLGHTACDYETARAAFEAGARSVTHLYNGMMPMTARESGLMGAAADSDCFAELICDGVHVHPSSVRAAFKLFGKARLVLVSDGLSPTSLGDGTFTSGGQSITVAGRRAALADGTLAGSVTTLMGCLRECVSMGIPLEDTIGCATVNPARLLGLERKRGAIIPGLRADLVLVDGDLNIKQVFIAGRPVA